MRNYRLSQVCDRINRFNATRVPEGVLTSEAVGEAVALLCSVPDPIEDREVAQAVGWLFWLRVAVRSAVDGVAELMVALDLLAPIYLLGGAVPDLVGELFDSNPPAEPDGAAVLARLGRAQYQQALENADKVALNRSVDLRRRAVAVARPDHPDRFAMMSQLANSLSRRYQSTGDLNDLEHAATLGRRVVAAAPGDKLNHSKYLTNLCHTLRLLFECTGQIADLDEAVEAGRVAVEATPPQHPADLAVFLDNLAIALLVRFRHTGSQTDLDQSIGMLQRAARVMPATSPERAAILTNLGAALKIRHGSGRRPTDLDEAIDTCREALHATPIEHPFHATRLSNFAVALQTRFEVCGDPTDLDEAVAVGRSVVAALPPDHPGRSGALSNYALALRWRHEHTGQLSDLDAAVDTARNALFELPADHPDRPVCLLNLGHLLSDRYTRTRADADLDAALGAAREATTSAETGTPHIRAAAARLWATLAATGGRWAEAVAGHMAAVDLMVRTVPRHLTRRDQEFLLDGTGEISSDAAACCVQAGSLAQAVEQFEQGRGLMLSQALDTRTDLTALAEHYPELADRFSALCAELNASRSTDNGDVAARRATASTFDRLVADIRELPGFDHFLHPLAAHDLTPDDGHIAIVSVSRFGSHALILSPNREVMAISLPTLTPKTVRAEVGEFLDAVQDTGAKSARTRAEAQDRMARTLGWLWDVLAGPVLDCLGITGPPHDGEPWPRLWWCPAGLLSFLPLQAAGYHDTAADPTPLTVLDRVVCSTTPTLRTLAHSRRGQASLRSRPNRAVVVAMPNTPGSYTDLPGAKAEADLVHRSFAGEVDVLTGAAATHDAVLAALAGARWAHFACHGHTDPADLSAGRLLLDDHHNRPLTVVDLARLQMDDPELAFLSACSSARPDRRLADEVIHLASAFQLAGYRHVIGTLWPINDQHAVDIADLVYAAIGRGTHVAAAVHVATRRMRDRWPGDPSVWASHIHVGA